MDGDVMVPPAPWTSSFHSLPAAPTAWQNEEAVCYGAQSDFGRAGSGGAQPLLASAAAKIHGVRAMMCARSSMCRACPHLCLCCVQCLHHPMCALLDAASGSGSGSGLRADAGDWAITWAETVVLQPEDPGMLQD